MSHYVIIANPISGSGLAARRFNRIAAELREHGHTVEHLETRSKEEAIRASREVDASIDALLSVGGDGTHNSVINGLVGRPIPLLPVPAGTENLLSRTVGIPKDAETIRRILESGRTRSLDVGLANGQAFAVMSGIGFDATVTGEVHARRRGPISRWWYFWPTLKNLIAYRWPHIDVEVDGRTVAEGAAFVIVGNMRMYADGLRVCANAVPDDGLLDVCIFSKQGGGHLVSYFLSTRFGKHLERDDVIYGQGRRIVVRPREDDVPFQVDGDKVGLAPVEYTVREKAVQMFVPAL